MKIVNRISKEPIQYFIALLLVFGNGTWLKHAYNAPLKAILISTLLVYILMLSKKRKLVLGSPFAIMVPLFLIISTLLNFSYQSNVFTLFSTFSIVFILSLLNKKSIVDLLDKYAEIILGLIYISFFITVVKIIYPGLPEHFPGAHFGPFSHYKNLFLYIDSSRNSLSPFRIQSIYWEPGAWAVNQAFAFYWYMIIRRNYNKYHIFLISAILTTSTSGLLFTFIFTIYLLLNNVNTNLTSTIKKLSIALVILIVSVIFYSSTKYFTLLPQPGQHRGSLFDVATRTFIYTTVEKFMPGGTTYGSNEDRLKTYYNAYELSKYKPFLGYGMLKQQYRPFATSVFAELVFQCGYLFTLCWLVLFYQLFKQISIIYSITLIFLILNAEAYAFGTLFILIIIFGAKTLGKKNIINTKTLNIGY